MRRGVLLANNVEANEVKFGAVKMTDWLTNPEFTQILGYVDVGSLPRDILHLNRRI